MKQSVSFIFIIGFIFSFTKIHSQIVLIGENPPHKNVNDGDFSTVWDYWRNASQSPFWTTKSIVGNEPMGLHYGSLFSSNTIGIAESKILNTNSEYQQPKIGDTLKWSFGADLEYNSKSTMSFSLVFGDYERILAKNVKLIGQDKTVEHFKGFYVITNEDAKSGLPFIRVKFYSEQDVKVYLHYVNISVLTDINAGPVNLKSNISDDGIMLSWDDDIDENIIFNIYRSSNKKQGFTKVGKSKNTQFLDTTIINGVRYKYLVTRANKKESASSNIISTVKKDTIPPSAPIEVSTINFDTEIKITWKKNIENDISHYSLHRFNSEEKNRIEIANNIKSNSYEDLLPDKEIEHTYIVYTHDFSGNKSNASEFVNAKVKTVYGASFRDLIAPIPIYKSMTTDTWGDKSVIPRDTNNGIEHPKWSYWGGRPIQGKDGKYHMLVVRWPEDGLKGHWEWPNSTVVHTMSETPTGPYKVKNDKVYDFSNSKGHNADVTQLNDGRYLLYSLIDWEPILFTSNSMSGPWQKEGVMKIEYNAEKLNDNREYQVQRNLSGVQLEDGSMLFVSKFGRMIKSTKGLLGPYKVLTDVIQKNKSIPERYRKSNYEDPVMWKDEVQYHCIINAFLDKRAIYLRSPDGIHWKFDPGIAYDPYITQYEDGTKTHWYKLERPHILQDAYGRATHLSLAALDVPKRDDYSNDNHNSKNIIVPLLKHKRVKLLNKTFITSKTKKIKILMYSENGFDAQKDIDFSTLKYGASEVVNYGKGCTLLKTKKKGSNIVLIFDGSGHGFTDKNFAGKLLGKTNKGELIVGFSKL